LVPVEITVIDGVAAEKPMGTIFFENSFYKKGSQQKYV
jgi:hypothetical protein